ncbi:hypothetical protein CDL15_Pgr018112 [Punica granatum]|uniref:Uncharacterized protein n=1 Tax=Punica granatum TaxID=22663 RepID=A0A218WHC3_PUNGR|nr:hypothetical protein CDL15_Pgr018112 [Punica granatum]
MAKVGIRVAPIGFLLGVFMVNTIISDSTWNSVGRLGTDPPSPSPATGDGVSAATVLHPLEASTAFSATFVALLMPCSFDLF